MKKVIKLIVTIVYLPIMFIVAINVIRQIFKYHRAGFKIIHCNNLYLLAPAMMTGEAEVHDIGDGYRVVKFPRYSLLAVGTAVIDENRNILTGCELASVSPAMLTWVVSHEKGHHEAPDGLSTKMFWWNPEDWLRIGQYAVFTPAELAADRWAITHGADPRVAIKHLASSIGVSPITCVIRIYHIWRYMKKNE